MRVSSFRCKTTPGGRPSKAWCCTTSLCFVDDGGYFLELSRLAQGMCERFPGFEAKQMNYSQILPGTIKAFHLHLQQEDIWFVPPHERALVVLSDQRKGSPTAGVTMRFVLGRGQIAITVPAAWRGPRRGQSLDSAGDGHLLCEPAVQRRESRRGPAAVGLPGKGRMGYREGMTSGGPQSGRRP